MSTHPLKTISAESRPHVERLRTLCAALPEVTEEIAWGTPTWRVGGRLFAQLADHHHGNPHLAVWLAAPDGAQEALIEAEPERFFRPAYVGHKGWVAAILGDGADWQMVEAVVRQAHREIAAKLGQKRAAMILAMAAEVAPVEVAPAEPAKRAAAPKKRAKPTPPRKAKPAAPKRAAVAKKATTPRSKKPAAKRTAPASRPASKRSTATARR